MNDTHTFVIPLDEDSVTLRLSHRFDEVRRRWDTSRHCNAEYELHVLLEGRCRLEIENEAYDLTAPAAVIIAPGQYHYPQVAPGPFQRFSLSFTLSGGQPLRALRSEIPVCRLFDAPDGMLTLCRAIFDEYGSGAPYRQEMLTASLTALIIRTLRQLNRLPPPQKEVSPVGALRTDLIDQYFVDHFTDSGGEEALAARLHISRRQLARVMYEHYGMGFRQKLLQTRMDRAAWLLRTTSRQISEIAFLTGYTSESAFFQVFKKEFHMTPRQYRLTHR